MANKDHSLDVRIIEAAKKEFLSLGYEKASLRKIASAADLTIGAIYTRYPTKDILFTSLCQNLKEEILKTFRSLEVCYQGEAVYSRDAFIAAMEKENDAVLRLIFDNYDEAVLLLCRSGGSSLENFFSDIVERKIRETSKFLKKTDMFHPDEGALKIIIKSQFNMYCEIVGNGYKKDRAKDVMNELMEYHMAGCMALFNIKKD